MLIVYSGVDEVIVCEAEAEKLMLSVWFDIGSGRELSDYDRNECPSGIMEIKPYLKVNFE